MKASTNPELACRYCHHYVPEGRRGGTCDRLGVSVQGQWSACSLIQLSLGEEQQESLTEPLPLNPNATKYTHA
jgi:hypothetical protein